MAADKSLSNDKMYIQDNDTNISTNFGPVVFD